MLNDRNLSGIAGPSSGNVDSMAAANPLLRPLLDALDEPALVVEAGIVRIANPAARALLGRAIEGSDIRIAIRHPKALEFVLAGRPGEREINGVGDLGRPWRLSLRRIADSALLLRLTDRSTAHAAEKMRVDFVANASHELRTPLTAVLGYAESIEDGDLDPQLSSAFAATIKSEAKRMLRIIEDLMGLSRIEADRFVAPTQEVAIADVVRSAVENVRSLAHDRRCDIRIELQEELPPIKGDFPQLVQVVDNLLSNALRYGCGEDVSAVRVSAVAENGSITVAVTDSGPGIAREHLPFITRRFYRVDPARSRDSGGTGLGLAIVKHIVERHRGMLSIDSKVGKGTTVTVTLPIDG
jgi:two-component system phosphate regulon sensor histidine kinase PhoR